MADHFSLMRALLITFFLFVYIHSYAQFVPAQGAIYEPVNSGVYDLLEECASMGYVDFDAATFPKTRVQITQLLDSASKRATAGSRLSKDITLWQRDHAFESKKRRSQFGVKACWDDGQKSKELWYEQNSDADFKFRIAPYASGSLMSNGEDNVMQRGIGLSFISYLGGKVGLYARLTDKGTTADFLRADYLSNEVGGNLKPNQTFFGQQSWDYSELNGGITYAWDWGHVGIVKERLEWGSNQFGANILSGRNPSNVMIDLEMKPTEWFSFKYVHQWLVSEVIDSTRTYLIPGGQRQVFTNKNLAANMFSLGPWKNVRFNFGNSIVYADNGIDPIYLIPIFFFKSADHNNSGAGSNQLGQNAQLFGDLSYRGIKGLWLYTTLFVDEVNVGRILDEENHTNLFSLKIGTRINTGAFSDLKNLAIKAEYTRTNPWTYRHQIPSTTYASNEYGIGHYLGENAEEWAASIEYRPVVGLRVELMHKLAYKGSDHEYAIINGNANVTGLEFLSPARWRRSQTGVRVDYHMMSNLMFTGSFVMSKTIGDESRQHPFFNGDRSLLDLGFRLGL
jgi:hypothetical protein